MDMMELLVDLHRDGARQGPGSVTATQLALALSGLSGRPGLRIADLGCGTGASTLALAEALNAKITALDLFPAFLTRLWDNARAQGLEHKIPVQQGDMTGLPFNHKSLDAI